MKFFVKSLVTLVIALFMCASTAHAHEILLYADQKAEVNQPVRIEFALGHFPDYFDHEHAFFQQVGASKLVVLDKNGVVIPLDYKLDNDRYVATFIPEQEGVYWVVSHTSRGVVDRSDRTPPAGMQLRFYDAKIPLVVGDAPVPEAWPTFLHTELQSSSSLPSRAGETFSAQVNYKGKNIAGQTVLVVSPSERVQELVTDADGRVEATLNEPGTWFIKTTLVDSARSGTYGGKVYDLARYNTSMYLQIRE